MERFLAGFGGLGLGAGFTEAGLGATGGGGGAEMGGGGGALFGGVNEDAIAEVKSTSEKESACDICSVSFCENTGFYNGRQARGKGISCH